MALTPDQQARLAKIRERERAVTLRLQGDAGKRARRTFLAAARADVPFLLDLVCAQAADAKHWHDTYQQAANAYDEFLTELLGLLPGAENTGMDAYDQIPRGIENLKAERDRLRTARDNVSKHNATADRILTEALKDAGVPPDKRPTLVAAATEAARLIRKRAQAQVEWDRLAGQVQRAQLIHTPAAGDLCYACGEPVPCPTTRALDGGDRHDA